MLTETWSFITAWYNLPFSILLFLCLILTGLQLVGLGGEQDSDVDLDSDLDTDFDADADADFDADSDLDGDSSLDQADDLDTGSGFSALNILAFIGVGKAPLFVVLIILFGAVGILGWVFNSLVESLFASYPSLVIAPVGLLSFLGGGLISSRVARFIGRALPPVSTTATAMKDLVGRSGVVLSRQLDNNYGLVRVRDKGGMPINVFAVVQSEEPIPQDSEIVLVSFDPEEKRYTATRLS
ncbi:MAG: DUF1449 family protein [Anaerolineae bacterium]|nr:DUF1449 family protein [Anaerolineae bacterium]